MESQPLGVKLARETLKTRTIIVASGAQPRRLRLPDEERLTGKGVSYCAMCDGMFYKDRVVAVVGGGNAAVEESLHLAHLVSKLYLVHRRARLRADKIYQDALHQRSDKIELVLGHTVTQLIGKDRLEGISILPSEGGEERRLDVAGLFVFAGIQPSGHFLPHSLNRDDSGFVHTDAEMATPAPGVFAAGDIRCKQCRQVVTAVGDGATAAYAAFNFLETVK